MYTDLEFYLLKYLTGTPPVIDNQSFAFYERKAAILLNRFTFSRITDITDDIKLCVCEMAEYLYLNKDNEGIVSENNDGYSVTYDKDSSQYDRLYKIAEKYLSGTGLLYRGI